MCGLLCFYLNLFLLFLLFLFLYINWCIKCHISFLIHMFNFLDNSREFFIVYLFFKFFPVFLFVLMLCNLDGLCSLLLALLVYYFYAFYGMLSLRYADWLLFTQLFILLCLGSTGVLLHWFAVGIS